LPRAERWTLRLVATDSGEQPLRRARTWLGRLLTRVLGMERKERVVRLLGERVLMTAERRRFFALRRTFEDRA
jgi:hypothetical protein